MGCYEEANHCTYRLNEEGERELLANFTARIKTETRITDGTTTETVLTLTGLARDASKKNAAIQLPDVDVPAPSYAGLAWVLNAWGARAIISPGHGIKDDLRTCIQQNSTPTVRTIYKSMGWTTIDGHAAYLHAGGAITSKGNDATIAVRLPMELQRYKLAMPTAHNARDAFWASLQLTTLGPKKTAWTLWTATYAPIFGIVDFATHVTGRSGTFKSEFISLFQSHYGPEMDARHLPGSWSSTPNALEAQAYYAQNAVFAIDDFVPIGTAYQVRSYQTGADKLIRGQGNQAGRARLTDSSGMQTTFFPRGIIMSTGEDTPEGHSVRARMMISEMSPGDIDPKLLSIAQKNRPMLVLAMTDAIRSLCHAKVSIEERAAKLRDENITIGHTRTPSMLGKLMATGEAVLQLARTKDYLTKEQHSQFATEMRNSLLEAASEQTRYLETTDPVTIFLTALKQALSAGKCHFRTLNGGIPVGCASLGWTVERGSGQMDSYKSHGPCAGWINWDTDELFLEADSGFVIIKTLAGGELQLTKQTVWKRLKEAGLLIRTDDARSRNTIRITAERHARTVLAMRANKALDTTEGPNNTREEAIPE